MHLCLQITEILLNIFESYEDDKEGKITLLHLALVCKFFHEPALDALWIFQRSLLTLVKTFPGDLWEETSETIMQPSFESSTTSRSLVEGAGPSTLSFRRPLNPSDWPRFQFYARRTKYLFVQRLYVRTPFSYQHLNADVFRAIENSLNLGHCHCPLLPNLSELTWSYDVDDMSCQSVCLFLGPRLTRLAFVVPSSLTGLNTFLKAVISNCCSLEILHIHAGFHNSEKVGRPLSGLCGGLSCLREASLWNFTLTFEVLVHLASLPMLWKLYVSLSKGHLLRTSQTVFPSLPFPALRNLHAYVISIDDGGEFLQVISNSSNLESLTIDVSTTPSPQELYTFLTTLRQSSSCDTLTTVSLSDHSDVDEDAPPSHSMEVHTILPLLQCPNLENLFINIHYKYNAIDNSFMEVVALAWPRLRNIAFYPHDFSHSNMNLGGLLYLAQHCCALESFDHEFDVSLPISCMDSETKLGTGIRNESMTHLYVGRSPITNPPAVAAFLSEVFPNLKLEYHDDDDEDDLDSVEMYKRWKEVATLLTTLAKKGAKCSGTR